MTRKQLLVLAATLVVVAGAVAAAAGLHHARVAVEREAARPAGVGDCVAVQALVPDGVQTQRASCTQDPSYTVGALVDAAGRCPTPEYQHFPAPAADRATAGLCLVPNLVADHCYRLGVPLGVVERAACNDPRDGGPDSGVLVQVTRRLDVHDQNACPAGGGSYAWPYPAPARTYCTATLY
ncbi:MAG: hypothetical protein U0Q20_05565 [Mycobacterium sp.]|nr:hypothetical protein [Mycobacterium sp.]